ncbi:PP2C family protein-serine/threonine phosphatase [Butyrivibrio sp. NC2007]|uniref:PP2C family protein-serine/threonine phosphatase n=1 Tax=Butyrivibrio sp. NC2007 TaxID=1280683 RepID=UPI0003B3EE74|nr:PP2C family protein-serine/threonine phosphatase [Butyrivibrio sp. NC2007]
MANKGKKRQKNKSLAAKVSFVTIIGMLIIGFVGLMVGLLVYVRTLINENNRDLLYVAVTAKSFLKDDPAFDGMAKEVMAVYDSMTEEERAKTGTEAYRERFAKITESEIYRESFDLLMRFRLLNALDNIYFVIYDKDSSSLVHIIDTDRMDELGFKTGEWEYIKKRDIEELLSIREIPCYLHRSADNHLLFTTGICFPVIDDETLGFILTDYVMDDMHYDVLMFLTRFMVAIVIVMIIFGLLFSRYLKRRLVKPINEIASAAGSYGEKTAFGEAGEGCFSSLDIHTDDEVEILADVMKQMEENIGAYVKKLTEMTAREERAKAELDTAAQIQKAALPDVSGAYTDRNDFDIYATMEPAKVVGGDFYDFFLVDDDHLCVIIADVSDKGMPAALFMMSVQAVIRNNAMMGKSPADVLTDTNSAIRSNNKLEMFVTVWLGILELSTGLLTYANAGHEPVAIQRGNGEFEFVKGQKKPAIGIWQGMKYLEQEIALLPGDKVFLYTDGVTEAQNDKEEFFGGEHLLKTLNSRNTGLSKDIVENVRNGISSFIGDAEQYDDITMLCLKYNSFNG